MRDGQFTSADRFVTWDTARCFHYDRYIECLNNR